MGTVLDFLMSRIWIYRSIIWALSIPFLGMPLAYAQSTQDWREGAMHMRLVDDLDRPQDGWCLDVVGSGPYIRFDMPLIGHNCKPGLFADEAVILRPDGTLFFPAYQGCVTVMGLNQFALPGASLMLKPCGHEAPFLVAENFQHFDHLPDGRVQLRGTSLCVTMGDVSEVTFDITHAWRTLAVQRCEESDLALSTWYFINPITE